MFFVLLVVSYVRPVHHNIREDLGRELREFGDEHGDEARHRAAAQRQHLFRRLRREA